MLDWLITFPLWLFCLLLSCTVFVSWLLTMLYGRKKLAKQQVHLATAHELYEQRDQAYVLLQDQYERLQGDYVSNETRLTSMATRLSAYEASTIEMETAVAMRDKWESQCDLLLTEKMSYEERLQKADTAVEKLTKDVKRVEEKNSSLQTKGDTLQHTVIQLRGEVGVGKEKIANLDKTIANDQQQLTLLQSNLAERDSDNEQLKAEIVRCNNQVAEVSTQLRQSKETNKQLVIYEKKVDLQATQLAHLKSELATYTDRYNELYADFEAKNRLLVAAESASTDVSEQLQLQKDKVNQLVEQHNQYVGFVSERDEKIAALVSSAIDKENAMAQLQLLVSQLKAKVQQQGNMVDDTNTQLAQVVSEKQTRIGELENDLKMHHAVDDDLTTKYKQAVVAMLVKEEQIVQLTDDLQVKQVIIDEVNQQHDLLVAKLLQAQEEIKQLQQITVKPEQHLVADVSEQLNVVEPANQKYEQLTAELSEKTRWIQTLEDDLEEKYNAIDEIRSRCDRLSADLSDRQSQLKRAEAETNKVYTERDRLSSENSLLLAQLGDKIEPAREDDDEIGNMRDTVIELQNALSTQQEKIDGWIKASTEHDLAISWEDVIGLQENIQQQRRKLVPLHRYVGNAALDCDAEIHKLNESVVIQDSQVIGLLRQLMQTKSTLVDQTAQLALQDNQLEISHRYVKQRTNELLRLQTVAADLRKAIVIHEKDVAQLQKMVARHDQLVEKISACYQGRFDWLNEQESDQDRSIPAKQTMHHDKNNIEKRLLIVHDHVNALVAHIETKQNEQSVLNDALHRKDEEVVDLHVRVGKLDKVIERQESKIDYLHGQIDGMHKEVRLKSDKLKRVYTSMKNKDGGFATVTEQIKELTNNRDTQRHEINQMHETLYAKDEKINLLQSQLQQLHDDLTTKQDDFYRQLTAAQNDVAASKETIGRHRQHIDDLTGQLDQMHHKVNVQNDDLIHFQERLNGKVRELISLNNESDKLYSMLEESEQKVIFLQQAIDEKEGKPFVVDRTFEQKRAERGYLSGRIDSLRAELQQQNNELHLLQKTVHDKNHMIDELHAKIGRMSYL